MQIIFRPVRHGRRGFALTITLIFLAITLIIFGSMMYWVSSNANVTQRNNQFNKSQAAAEAAVETVLSKMNYDFRNQSLTNYTYYQNMVQTGVPGQTNWPVQYQFSTTNGTPNSISVIIGTQSTMAALGSEFAGLSGMVIPCEIIATATPLNQPSIVPATVDETFQAATIPLFQYDIFYNMDLEINPGDTFNVNGRGFSNGNIWATGSSPANELTFSSYVQAVKNFNYNRSPNDQNTSGSGANIVFTITANNPSSLNNAITMPVGTNIDNDPAAVEAI